MEMEYDKKLNLVTPFAILRLPTPSERSYHNYGT